MGPTWCCCELKSRAVWRTWQHLNPTSWKRTGCRGPTQAPPCTIAARWARWARWARSAAPWMVATAAKPAAAAAASSDRRARDTATDRPSKSEDKRGGGGKHSIRARRREAVYLPARCFSFEIRGRLGAPISTGEGQDRGSNPRPPPESMTPLHATWSSSSGWGGWRRHQPAMAVQGGWARGGQTCRERSDSPEHTCRGRSRQGCHLSSSVLSVHLLLFPVWDQKHFPTTDDVIRIELKTL